MRKLIEAGYSKRLMLDDWPGDPVILKPAMKGSEGERAPWEVRTLRGCTFWKEGKCELHVLGLKPTQGRLAHHTLTDSQEGEIAEMVRQSWKDDNFEKGETIINQWKETNKYKGET
jgi:hypothetical protein